MVQKANALGFDLAHFDDATDRCLRDLTASSLPNWRHLGTNVLVSAGAGDAVAFVEAVVTVWTAAVDFGIGYLNERLARRR